MELFLSLYVKVTVGFIHDVIECIDMDSVVAFFTFMDKSPFIRRVSGYILIGAVSGQKPVAAIQVIGQGPALCYKGMEQEIPSFRKKLVTLLCEC